QDHIDFVLKTIRNSVDSGFSPTKALDFGCGVGRCAIPLSRLCQSVVGVDVSESMLQEAGRNCAQQSITNLALVSSDDRLSLVSGPFDLVHSFLVFQHIPSKRGEKIFARLIEILSNNGVGVVQFVYHREAATIVKVMGILRKKIPLWHRLVNLLYGKSLSEPLMEKNVYDLNRLVAILQRYGCGNVYLQPFGKGKLRSVVLFFQKKENKAPYERYAELSRGP